MKRDATHEGRTDWHYSVGWEWYHPSACTFNATHRTLITHDTVEKLITKFKRTGSVADASRSRRPKTATDEDTSTRVPTAIARSPTTLCTNGNQPKFCHTQFVG
ncbi:hypothetical protein AVEN_28082-1 [Araneus ventricosus]|uniref:DUF4817 domain-containing protein n=1 Tax=Araneus ventricosus TaxID=182803 RepID=A0A4Y2NZU1_ARAVE|nr:hypothetical protein AVEN_28082-1 [Araneus ventricosus]